MTVEVKGEVFGSRPSLLEPFLKENKIEFEKNIFVLTCRRRFNNNIRSRYLILKEFVDKKEINEVSIKNLSEVMREFMKERVWGCYVDEREKRIVVIRKNNIFTYNYFEFRELVLGFMECEFKESVGESSCQSTPLSRFFRSYLGKSVSITDLDFFIPASQCFLEEKTFILEGNYESRIYLGLGQFASLKELKLDVLNQNVPIFIVHTEDCSTFLIREFDANIPYEKIRLRKWGNGIALLLDKTLTKEEFIQLLRNRKVS